MHRPPVKMSRDVSASRPGRLLQLEGLRGLASVIVVTWHFVWAFTPWELGGVAGLPSHGLVGSPALAAIDGPAAVALFFLLSGFVISLAILRTGNSRNAAKAAAKRWFRLAGLSVLAVLLSYALFRLGLYRYREAAGLTGSAWLGAFGGGDPAGALNPSLGGALHEGLIGAFVAKSDAYDPVLWTMRDELLGSFLSIAAALVMARTGRLGRSAALLIAMALAPVADPWLIPFVFGIGLAWLAWSDAPTPGPLGMIASIAMGVYLFGYLEPHGAYAAIPVLQDAAGYRYDRILLHSAGAFLIIFGLLGSGPLTRLLSIKPLQFLGRLSFPVYLFHFPLLCSLACGLFVLFRQGTPYAVSLVLVLLIYVPVVLTVSLLFARVDELWAVRVNRIAERLIAGAAYAGRGCARGFRWLAA